MFKAKSAEILD